MAIPTGDILAGIGILTPLAIAGFRKLRTLWQKRQAFIARMNTSMGYIEKVQGQLSPNGGSSIVDSLARIEIGMELDRTSRRTFMKESMTYELVVQPDGSTTVLWVSPGYQKLTGLSAADYARDGWVRSVDDADREDVLQAVTDAEHHGTMAVMSYRVHNVLTGDSHMVRHESTPVYVRGKLTGWVGVLTIQD